ncbi:MAG: FliH/SctL family protein [Suilimivivens sp.]
MTRLLSSNLYKSGWVVVQDDEKRVIDNNALLEEKLSAVLHAASFPEEAEFAGEENGFTGGLDAEPIDALFDQEGEGTVIKAGGVSQRDALLQEIEQAKEELAALKAEADGMIEDARSQIGAMQMKAYEEAKEQGYQEGQRLGRQEAEEIKNEYLARKKQLESDYEKKLEELEPEFIETLTGIYEHIFKVDLSGYRDLVVNLLVNVIQKTESTRSFLVHVSREDYEGVIAQKERIRAEAGGSSVSVEFVEDATLSCAQCFIETENGIYDCSLDTQLSELSKKLKLLSYERN